MLNLSKIEARRAIDMCVGTLGIYLMYLVSGVLHEYMMKEKYLRDGTEEKDNFIWPIGFLIFPTGLTWVIGYIINTMTLNIRTDIPSRKSIMCALAVSTSTLTYVYAIYLTNFPIVMMFKSCNILSVLLVAILCSKIKRKDLKLGCKKLVVGTLITIGIILFEFFDENLANDEKNSSWIGLALIFVSLLADGFLPDFQADIKAVEKPQPIEMMEQINKWVCLLSLAWGLLTGELFLIIDFMMNHKLMFPHMFAMGILSSLGQLFVYRMIKQFKQHIVPFIITTRKIITVGLSIIYFSHKTNIKQITGIIIVFIMVTYEFISELTERQEEIEEKACDMEEVSPHIEDNTSMNDEKE